MSPLGTSKGTKKLVTMTVTQTPSTSSASTSTGHQIGTVMVSASAEETKMAIAALFHLEVTFHSRMMMLLQRMHSLYQLIL